MSLLPAAGICYTVSTLIIPIVSCGQIALETIRKWEVFIMSDERGQNLFIIAYPGRETADKVYHTLRELEKQDRIDIKTAATIYRREDGKLRLKHRQRLTLWRDEFGVEAIALMLAGTRAGKLAGAVVDALMGSHRLTHRREASALMEGKLGPDDSAMVIVATNAEWEAVKGYVEHLGGEELAVELTAKAEKRLAEIASDEGVAAAVREFVEIEEVTL
jgi:uncharacterized membrane protein